MRRGRIGLGARLAWMAAFATAVAAQGQAEGLEARAWRVTEERVPCAGFDAERRPFFGDTHVHTVLSFDAFLASPMADARPLFIEKM